LQYESLVGLVGSGVPSCSPALKELVCSVTFGRCDADDVGWPSPPCSRLCSTVEERCGKTLSALFPSCLATDVPEFPRCSAFTAGPSLRRWSVPVFVTLGLVVALIALVALFLIFYKRRKLRKDSSSDDDEHDAAFPSPEAFAAHGARSGTAVAVGDGPGDQWSPIHIVPVSSSGGGGGAGTVHASGGGGGAVHVTVMQGRAERLEPFSPAGPSTAFPRLGTASENAAASGTREHILPPLYIAK
jgi:hypothetical protein